MSNAPPNDALMLLIQRISDAQVQQGQVQARLADDQAEIKLTLTALLTRLEPLPAIVQDLNQLKLTVREHELRLDSKKTRLDAVAFRVDTLCDASSKRSGWESFGGKLLYLTGGVLITAALGIMVSPNRAKAIAAPAAQHAKPAEIAR